MQFLSFVLVNWFLARPYGDLSYVSIYHQRAGWPEFCPITTETNLIYWGQIVQEITAIWSLKQWQFLSNTFFLHQSVTVLKWPIIASEKCHENISSREQSNSNDDTTKVWPCKIYELFTLHFIYACFPRLERLETPVWLACVRMKGIYNLLVLISMLFSFTGGRPVSPGRASCLPMLGFKLLHEITPLREIYDLEN